MNRSDYSLELQNVDRNMQNIGAVKLSIFFNFSYSDDFILASLHKSSSDIKEDFLNFSIMPNCRLVFLFLKIDL